MKRENGFVLIATLLIMVAVAILVFGTMFTTLVDRQVSANQQGAATAYYLAQSGLQQAKTRVFRGLVDHFKNAEPTPCEESLEGGNQQAWQDFLDEVLGDRGEWIDFPNKDNPIGQFRITTLDPPIRDSYLVLISNGRVGNARATVQLIASAGAGLGGAWNNAITATGRDPTTRAINGNVAIYGSVQIVRGDVELDENLALHGTAGVFNNYYGNNGQQNSDIRIQMARATGALLGTPGYLPDLCARIKIEKGHLFFDSGAAQVGAPGNPIYSIHLSEGYRVCRRNGGVCGQNGWITNHHTSSQVYLKFPEEAGIVSPYDGYHIDLPKLDVSYPNEPYPQGTNFNGAPLKAWDYLTNDVEDPGECEWLLNAGTVRLPPNDLTTIPPQFHYRNETLGVTYLTCFNGIEDYFNQDRILVQDQINQIIWSNETAHVTWVIPDLGTPYLRVHGWVSTGDYPIRLDEVRYEGRGVLRAGRCNGGGGECTFPDSNALIEAYGEISPRNGGYPANHSLGLVSSGDILIENSPGEVAALLAFASGEVTLVKQTLVAGAIIATAFDMGQQVPKVAYHPDVGVAAEAMCMPGSNCMLDALGDEIERVGRVFGEISYERR